MLVYILLAVGIAISYLSIGVCSQEWDVYKNEEMLKTVVVVDGFVFLGLLLFKILV